MWSITIKLMKHSKKMLIPAGIAVMIGTAFIACTFLFGNTISDSLRSQMTAQLGQANYIIATKSQSGATSNIEDFHREKIAAIAGVKGIRPEASTAAALSHAGHHVSSMAIVTAADKAVLPVEIASGTQPAGEGQIAIPQGLAKQLKAGIGDVITLDSASQDDPQAPASQHLRVVGLTDDPNGAYSYYGGASIVSENVMAALYSLPGKFGSLPAPVWYLDIDTAHEANATTAIKPLLPRAYTLQTRQSVSTEALESTNSSGMNPVTIFLLVFGVIAMFVAAMVIANTFQVLVMQRRRTFALLRTIGAKKGQIYRSVILESVLFSLLSSALGVLLGIAIMAIACQAGVFSKAAPNARLILSSTVFAVPLVFGVVMTVLASLGSARAATKVTPLEALRPMELGDSERSGWLRNGFGTLCTVAGLAGAGWSISRMHAYLQIVNPQGDNGYSTMLLTAIASCVLIFLVLSVTAVSWLPRLMRGAGGLVALTGPSAKVAHANIQKNPRRVGATGLALLIGVTLVVTIATGAASGRKTIENALDSRYSVDLVVVGNGLDRKSETNLKAVKGVTSTMYAPYTSGQIKDGKGKTVSTMLIGVSDVATLQSVMRTNLQSVSLAGSSALFQASSSGSNGVDLSKSSVRFSDDAANDKDNRNGSGTTRGHALDLNVMQGSFRQLGVPYQAVAFVGLDHFTNGQLADRNHIMLAKVDARSSSLADVLSDAQAALGDQSQVQIMGPIAERMQWESIINVMMAMLIGLLAVAVLIALIGVANTLMLSVIERTRESATLRAIGMTRAQLRRSLAVEALLIAVVSGVTGIVLGTAFGWLGSYMVFSLFGTVAFPLDWVTNIAVLVIASVAALLASVIPARHALRTSPVVALAEA